MMNTQHYGGIDVAKQNLVIATTASRKTKTEANTEKGFLRTIEHLKKHQVSLVVMESTGGLEIPLAKALYHAGFQVIIANPRQTSQFAKSQSFAKTDAADAQMLAFYAQMMAQKSDYETLLYTPPSEAEEVLEALVKRKNQLVDIRAAEKNRLQQVHASQKRSVESLIAHLDRLIAELDQDISDHNDRHFKDKSDLLQSVKGIGKTTAALLCAMLPEPGKIPHKQLAGIVGVAPHPRESGNRQYQSRCFGGRRAVRKALYMAAMVASQHEGRIKAFYRRLLSRGKAYKVAITACMRKLLTILNAMVRDWLQADKRPEGGVL